ncbi:LOW QUALITY PROTEIN: bidirectional sugar transporter SWEET4-like protein [Cinnamomum micranthum f. kanehirae]|uniref:Bidirectional sugar transporter SWEET n=1 Tax=Cinnamomum micranthum f. kanehirae TaxID=337451 RepID=A0A443PFM3_9MAGN|nr:LOW QUALITY PROTEIN: bidirectional sugar transporter SWEET4-like protein [Cinnamomum micranthum f. kanehirae]
MVSADLARTVVGIIEKADSREMSPGFDVDDATVVFHETLSHWACSSPQPTFIQIWKKGSVEQFSPVPYLATLLQCMLWVVYGLPLVHPHSVLVLTLMGCVIEFIYVVLFLVYSDRKKRLKVFAMLVMETAFVVLVFVLVLTLAHTYERRSLIVGVLCVVFGTMMYVAPLSVLKLVIKTKSVEFMPLSLSIASFLNGICWTSYALIRFDLFITIPNGLGTLFAIVQLVLYATFYKSTQRQLAEGKRKGDGLTEVVVMGDARKVGNAPIYNNRAAEIRET